MTPKVKRVLLKLSGEVLAGEKKTGFDDIKLMEVAQQVKELKESGIEVAVVVGGGNFWRGRTSGDMDRPTADYIGMLATCMNALALEDAFRRAGLTARVQTAIPMKPVAEPFSRKEAVKALEAGEIVIFGGGTGSPFFSTDTTAALRAAEIGADVILFGKAIDAVYSADPAKDSNAVRYDRITFQEVLEKNLQVMDQAAAAICKDNGIKVHVFELAVYGNIIRAANGEDIGTLVE